MSIRSLVNQDTVNITNCESEAIHIPGSIQSHGYLLGVSHEEHFIRYCSENCVTLFETTLQGILGKPLSQFFSVDDMEMFKVYNTSERDAHRPFAFSIGSQSFHTTVYTTKEAYVLEFEKLSGNALETAIPPLDQFFQTRQFAYHTESADNLQTLCELIADGTRRITGYDRVMIYRFDKASNGEVFAESKVEGIESFLGLHYPASDIPAQARELFLLNQIRMLVDVDAPAVPLFMLDGEDGNKNLDLSLSTLRSMSPIHIQYLKNMGVCATFNIALIHQGKLWGLIACHHYASKHLSYHTRLAVYLQSIFLSSQIDVRQIADEFKLMRTTEKKLDEVKELLAGTDHGFADSSVLRHLRGLLNADGIIVFYHNYLYRDGLIPEEQALLSLIDGMAVLSRNTFFHTAELAATYPEGRFIDKSVAGLVYMPMSKNSRDCVLWTRQEREKMVPWGGDPNKPMEMAGGQLAPRKSFALWKELVKGQSLPWRKPELNVALDIGAWLQHQLQLSDMKADEQRYRSLNERLQKANEELENMNWISTHDLKEPLRKIQLYASIILGKQEQDIPDRIRTNVSKMQTSAARMQALIDELLAYTKIVNHEKQFVKVDLNAVMEDVKEELKEVIEEKVVTLIWEDLPVIKGILFQVHQLLINLIGNAVKFGKEGVPQVVKVSSQVVSRESSNGLQDYYELTVADNGLGFNPANRTELFKMFKRFHGPEIAGTGIGLAICRKIAEAHNGFIEAIGEEGIGASFSVYFPVHQAPAAAAGG